MTRETINNIIGRQASLSFYSRMVKRREQGKNARRLHVHFVFERRSVMVMKTAAEKLSS